MYTLFKAITAIQLAARVTAEHGVPAVPVLWVHSEDHDWDEVSVARVLDANLNVVSITAPAPPGAGAQPTGSLVLSDGTTQSVAGLERALAPTEFTAQLRALLERRYRPRDTMASAFAGLMDDLLGRHGLVVYDAADPAAKRLAADLFRQEVGEPGRTGRLAREGGARMAKLGHAPQVEPAEDALALFHLDGAGRRPIRRRADGFAIDDKPFTAQALAAEVAAHPERFSPNVLLRPVVQDHLFPAACYVAGPSELAYLAQLGGVYRAFGVEPSLVYARASATLIDAATGRFLERSGMPFEDLHARDDSALNHVLERQLPPDLDQAIERTAQAVGERAAQLRAVVASIDPTLTGTVETTETRIRETLTTLHGKIIQAVKRKDETLRRQFARARALTFPDGQPQERIVSVPFFLNRYGVGLTDRLLEVLPLDTSKHWLIQL
jgi:bacillithiol biosynthesis cysteine-adding enzyme BshC